MAEPHPGFIAELLALAAAEPGLARLLADPRPVVVVSPADRRLVWANPAAVTAWSIERLGAPAEQPPDLAALLADALADLPIDELPLADPFLAGAEPEIRPLPLAVDPAALAARTTAAGAAGPGAVEPDATDTLLRLAAASGGAAILGADGNVLARSGATVHDGGLPTHDIDLGDGRRLVVATVPTAPQAPSHPPAVEEIAGPGRSLSRPEWEAFRQVAIALGARFEGDHAEAAEADPAAPEDAPAIDVAAAAETGEASLGRVFLDRLLIDRIPLPLIVSRGEDVLHVNAAALALLGHRDRAGFVASGGLGRLLEGPGSDRGGERRVRVRRSDGSTRDVAARLQSVPWNDGPAMLVALFAEEGRPSAAPERSGLDAVPDPVLILDEDGTVILANAAAVAAFGDGLVGEPVTAAVAAGDRLALAGALEALFAATPGAATALDLAPADGAALFAARLARADAGGRRVSMTLREVGAERARAQALATELAAAREESRRKSEILARLAHEIRTPMNAVIGFADGLAEGRLGSPAESRQREYLRDLRSCGEHVVALLDGLLDIAKIEAGASELAIAPTPLAPVVEACTAMMRTEAAARRVLVRTRYACRPTVLADALALRQIVINLMSNAIRFSAEGGEVLLAITAVAGEIRLSIADAGIGMTAAEIDVALAPFRQVRAGRGGTGLGLPLTKALVGALGARFDIRSAPGRGTRVEITFPADRVVSGTIPTSPSVG